MKKIRITIISIYFLTFILITSYTVYFVASVVKKVTAIYFQEIKPQETKIIDQKEIEEVINLFKKFKLIKE